MVDCPIWTGRLMAAWNQTPIECKWRPEAFETRGLAGFRAVYPRGRNFVVSPLSGPAYERTIAGLKVLFISPKELRTLVRQHD